ncbi:hydrolase [Planotetraspora thailandica]|uniref:Hydrolase n=1 Tax=Planotetraspora thailandica TaxID=487172 RepID=A0A8J3XTH7_9ACTN|nr:alpha/beta hydrolase [Planotetraspora thailandica]GII52160.1 hydrolase [Planotetraspora thailandica]
MVDIHHRTTKVGGHEVFYREAGLHDAFPVVLLHGFPASSHMFRRLIPALADRYRVIAPDYLGFGYSAAPSPKEFPYTFDALTEVTHGLLEQLGLHGYAIYVQDYGAPVGWRLALEPSAPVRAIVTQNGNGYTEGFVEPFWAPIWAYADDPGPDNEEPVRQAFTLEAIRWQYEHGVPDPSLISPDAWTHDHTRISRPGNDEIQLALFRDYVSNLEVYPRLHEYFRTSQVPLLAVWGAGDGIFGPDGARAFARDLSDAEIHLLDAGHFALESELDTIAGYMRGFLGRVVG